MLINRRILKHYRFGLIYAWLTRRRLKNKKHLIKKVRNLYKKTGLETRNCLLCGKNNFSLVCRGDRYGFDLKKQICKNCGLVQTNPSLGQQFHNEFYTHYYRPLYIGGAVKVDYDSLVKEQIMKGNNLLAYLTNYGFTEKSLQQLSLIEIGCSSGGILKTLEAHVKSVQGCDLDREAIQYAKENLAINVEVASYPSKLPLHPRLFIMSHVLEHLYDPLAELKKIQGIMTYEDYLYISVPGLNNVATGNYNHNLLQYFHIAHVTDFTASTLAGLTSKAGFKALNVDEDINGLFVSNGNQKVDWKPLKHDAIDNLLRIEATYNN